MELKKLIGSNSYWTINKALAKEYGLNATLVLQHLIDLEENYFKGDFWQTSKSLQESVGLSKYLVSEALKLLIKSELILVENKVRKGSRVISKVYHFTLLKENISKVFNQCQSKDLTNKGKEVLPTTVKEFNRVDKEKLNKEKLNKVLDVPSDDDIKGKIFFKIVELYPKNRIGNRQHGLKKFKQLDINQAKLAAVNLKRYLTIAGAYVKSLQNYIDEACYSEEWISGEEETKSKKTTITNTKDFDTNY
tara:strand:+ start:516 stop:1262 length:747 start_codon:yes stop_codon:yes gene_type:complete